MYERIFFYFFKLEQKAHIQTKPTFKQRTLTEGKIQATLVKAEQAYDKNGLQ